MSTVVASKAVCFADGPREGWLAIDGGTIVDHGTDAPPASAVDLGAHVLSPGFVDLQCNGLGDIDLATADAAAWTDAQRTLARHGVTSYCPTFVTAPLDAYPRFLDAAEAARASSGPDEASIVGVHLEGPFLGGALGAHDPKLARAADLPWLRNLVDRHPGLVRLVTLAPEADVDLETTRWLSSSGIAVALGHTTASYDDARAAADAGASVVTHLYNGMSPWHHRDPGVAGAALTDDRLTPTVIADLVHVHPAALRLAFDATRLAVVSDSVGVVDGITAGGGAAQLPDGTLAGATMLLDGALTNLVAIGIAWPRAIESVTAVPALLLGLDDRGVLAAGSRADLVALDPDSFRVERVWVAGVEQPNVPKGGRTYRATE